MRWCALGPAFAGEPGSEWTGASSSRADALHGLMMRGPRPQGQLPHPAPQEPAPIWLSLVWRVLLALGLIGIALSVHWLDRDGLRDNIDGHVTFADVLYFTMITITTVRLRRYRAGARRRHGCSIPSWSRRCGCSCG